VTAPLFRLDRVSLPGPRRARLEDVTVEIPPGRTAVIGPSGAGKTSLLNLLVGFERPASGRIEALAPSSSRLPMFWSPADGGLWPGVSIADHVRLVMPGGAPDAAVTGWLERFDLDAAAAKRVEELSAGERSRLSVARALAAEAEVLVLDEPLVHVDPGRLELFWGIIREACDSRGTSLVFSSHQPEVYSRQAERVIRMELGQVVSGGECGVQTGESPHA
jgi:iron(III) transport system ATP-binding protein